VLDLAEMIDWISAFSASRFFERASAVAKSGLVARSGRPTASENRL